MGEIRDDFEGRRGAWGSCVVASRLLNIRIIDILVLGLHEPDSEGRADDSSAGLVFSEIARSSGDLESSVRLLRFQLFCDLYSIVSVAHSTLHPMLLLMGLVCGLRRSTMSRLLDPCLEVVQHTTILRQRIWQLK